MKKDTCCEINFKKDATHVINAHSLDRYTMSCPLHIESLKEDNQPNTIITIEEWHSR